jgi:hypothetical protein
MNVKPLQQSVDHEDWLHLEKTKRSLKKAVSWAIKNPAKSSDPEQLLEAKRHTPKHKVRLT